MADEWWLRDDDAIDRAAVSLRCSLLSCLARSACHLSRPLLGFCLRHRAGRNWTGGCALPVAVAHASLLASFSQRKGYAYMTKMYVMVATTVTTEIYIVVNMNAPFFAGI